MTARYWTLDEARAALPRLRELLGVVRKAATLSTHVRSNGHARLGPAELGPTESARSAGERSEVPDEIAGPGQIRKVLEEIESFGIVLRDPARGLVDFPTVHLGRIVYLCWQLGEDDIDWWHLPEEGFGGRQRLPLPDHW